ncbi:MAG: hypothetical protein LBE56_12815 [Tannerella sp.]|nr:hypothetical protein [Tannerella sp.]
MYLDDLQKIEIDKDKPSDTVLFSADALSFVNEVNLVHSMGRTEEYINTFKDAAKEWQKTLSSGDRDAIRTAADDVRKATMNNSGKSMYENMTDEEALVSVIKNNEDNIKAVNKLNEIKRNMETLVPLDMSRRGMEELEALYFTADHLGEKADAILGNMIESMKGYAAKEDAQKFKIGKDEMTMQEILTAMQEKKLNERDIVKAIFTNVKDLEQVNA